MKHAIFIIDDHPIMLRGYRFLIEQEPDLRVCGEAYTAEEALERIPRALPDLVIADISLEGMNGIEFTQRLRTERPGLPVLIVSMHDESLYGERALRAGARGYLMKNEVDTTVIAAIRRILDGGFYVTESLNTRLLAHYMGHPLPYAPSPLECLTDRELEVFEHLGRGLATKEIAEALHISPKTVETHRRSIKTKLGLTTNAKLLQRAVQWAESEQFQ